MPVPELIKAALDRYVNSGIKTGGFLHAILTNDLFEVMCRADRHNAIGLFEICGHIYHDLPSDCWGSKEKVEEWLDKFKETENASTD